MPLWRTSRNTFQFYYPREVKSLALPQLANLVEDVESILSEEVPDLEVEFPGWAPMITIYKPVCLKKGMGPHKPRRERIKSERALRFEEMVDRTVDHSEYRRDREFKQRFFPSLNH
jgi:hypothetical protein